MKYGSVYALCAAVLFGISPVLIKGLIGDVPPLFVAGLLYLGSGLGLAVVSLAGKESLWTGILHLKSDHRKKLLGAIISGGVLAPICLAYGIKLATAFEVSLLLNLETVTTTIIAAIFFHEHIGKRVWMGKVFILVGAGIVSFWSGESVIFSLAAFFIILACIFWGIDNNLTRDVDELSPVTLASIKGLSAGAFNTLLALVFNPAIPSLPKISGLLLIGVFSYGLSLVFFVYSLRLIGTSRTTTYFAAGPFFGIIAAVTFLGERPPELHWQAAAFAFCGVWLLMRENHEHTHTHEVMTHSHKHAHDEHHQHQHEGTEGEGPHEHVHTHEGITHSHKHLPDIHHRHKH